MKSDIRAKAKTKRAPSARAEPTSTIAEEVLRTLEVMHPNDLIELFVAEPGVKTGRLYSKSHDAVIEEILRLEKDFEKTGKPYQYYTLLNRIDPKLESRITHRIKWSASRTKGSQITRRQHIGFDHDPKRDAGTSATDEEKALAEIAAQNTRDFLTEDNGWPEPIVADSGNGYWDIYEVDFPKNAETTELIKNLIAFVDAEVEHEGVEIDASVYDPPRLVKLFGTPARKGENTPERPHRMSKLVSVPENRVCVTLDDIIKLVPVSSEKSKRQINKDDSDAMRKSILKWGHTITKEKTVDDGLLFEVKPCPFPPQHTNKSGWYMLHYDGRKEAGCPHNGCVNLEWPDAVALHDPHHAQPSYFTPHPYEVQQGRYVIRTKKEVTNADGDVTTEYDTKRLTNFTAKINRFIEHDNAREVTRYYDIEGRLDDGTMLPEIRVEVDKFGTMEWLSQWGGLAEIHIDRFFTPHARAAIKFTSINRGYEKKKIYGHIGWREVDGEWMYLHQGGAIDENGLNTDVSVTLEDDDVFLYELEEPPTGQALIDSCRKEVDILLAATPEGNENGSGEIAEWLIYFDIAAVHRAPLDEVLAIISSSFDFGITGALKSAYAAVLLAHYGRRFTSRTLPANWSSTPNRNEAVLYRCKDAFCVIDDYKPMGNAQSVAKKQSEADRMFRSHANVQGRGRMDKGLGMAKTQKSRAYPKVTGEDIMQDDESGLARTAIREIKREEEDAQGNIIQYGDIPTAWLKGCQQLAAAGVLVFNLSGYAKWLAPQIAGLKASNELFNLFVEKRDEYREKKLIGSHPRVYEAMADLWVGWEMLMRFWTDVGAIDSDERVRLTEVFERINLQIGEQQLQYIQSSEPTRRFLEGIKALLASGGGHLAEARPLRDEDGNLEEVPQYPLNPLTLGWSYGREQIQRDESKPGAELKSRTWVGHGKRIGWVDEDRIYLQPEAAFSEVQSMLGRQRAGIPLTQHTLYRNLAKKRIAQTEGGAGKSVKIQLKTTRAVVLPLREIISPDEDGTLGGY